ncbi:MAG: DNA polymerase III subunit gamma/tau, partial [Thermoanaerobaculales bacterium]|nr:DNA polymerase III subunit gamma/tau [Thermoanaerobaculales bacterium]
MTYQVLARTWRPQLFADVIGQEAVVQTLHNALSSATLGHAYIFSGLRGVGKTTLARLLAKAVNCEKGPSTEPCGECVSCLEITEGSSLDLVELDGASNRGIDDVRELKELLRFTPIRDRFRVIIIDEVHMLTREAFNALLKSLEEPPPYILFIFATTEIHKVPPTILSRCQQLEFRPVPLEKITERLMAISKDEGFELSRDGASMVARAAQGSVRDALSLIDQLRAFSADQIDAEAVAEVLGVPRFEVVVDLISGLAAGDSVAGLGMLRAEMVAGHDAWVLYQEVGRVLRLMLHLAVNPELADDLADEQRECALGVAAGLGSSSLIRMAGLWLEHENLISSAANRELALEVACLRLARWPAVQRVEALLRGETPPPANDSRGKGTGFAEARPSDGGSSHG